MAQPGHADFGELVDLAAERLGGAVIYANDEFFASKDNLLKAERPVFIEGKYTDRGKWMDGWESRRRRTPGHDFCIIRLALPGVVRGVDVDTSFFKGNFPESCSIEALAASGQPDPELLLSPQMAGRWIEILPRSPLKGDSSNRFDIDVGQSTAQRFTHLRLNIFPDGGVARLRVYGEVVPDPRWLRAGEVDLASIENGGRVIACNDMFFGSRHNLIMPGRGVNMGDGWETRRSRRPGPDWVILRLAAQGIIERIEVDTTHFKGNAPESCSIAVCDAGEHPSADLLTSDRPYTEILPRTRLLPHARHFFEKELVARVPATHVRFCIFPDGGISRLRLFGTVTRDGRLAAGLARLNHLPEEELAAELRECCGSRRWAAQLAARRPFHDLAELRAVGGALWEALPPQDWMEALLAHPRIGERKTGASAFARWSTEEQAGARAQDGEAVAAELLLANHEYEARFGHLFIVCASGKGAAEMLAILKARMGNEPEAELRVAAAEQRKITDLRLEKLVLQ